MGRHSVIRWVDVNCGWGSLANGLATCALCCLPWLGVYGQADRSYEDAFDSPKRLYRAKVS